MSNCTVYIDESGDLGYQRGTKWFVLSAVIVDKQDEPLVRGTIEKIRSRLNIKEIHVRKITDFYKRAYIVKELNDMPFIYSNVIVDTSKIQLTVKPHTLVSASTVASSDVAYNYACRVLLERVSWLLRDTNRVADIVLSARGTSKDKELVEYIKTKLIPYSDNQIVKGVFCSISAQSASSRDLLQLADVCATTMFLSHEINGWGFCTPCYAKVLKKHLYYRNGNFRSYGLKYLSSDMKPNREQLKCQWVCTECIKKERTPGATTT